MPRGFRDIGTPARDTLTGGLFDDTLIGRGDADELSGLFGRDRLLGGGGNDVISGDASTVGVPGEDDDTIIGGSGDDTISGGIGVDSIVGGEGFNSVVLRFLDATGPVTATGAFGVGGTLTFSTGTVVRDAGRLQVLLTPFDDQLTLSAADDLAAGEAGADSIMGGNGADLLQGGADADTLHGGAGDDRIDGGTGLDLLVGGTGADTFEFAELVPLAADRIRDFDVNADRLFLAAFGNDVPGDGPEELFEAIADGFIRLVDRADGLVIQYGTPVLGVFVDAILLAGVQAAELGTEDVAFLR